MKCIIEFLSDKNQKELRRLAQVQCESYEDCIDEYKKLFIVNFLELKGKCPMEDSNESDLCKVCSNFKKILDTVTNEEIEEFFNTLKDVYIKWIDANTGEAVNKLKDLLIKYDILNVTAEDINKDVFFKGRKNNNILTRWDMFHIPFNKRYLIQNQRYSLTGQPIIYLGKSVVDVIEELGIENEEELKISSFQINGDLKIYDLRNNIFNDITKGDVSTLLGNDAQPYNKIKFFKNILSSVCSFERRREHKQYSFCEEYVIPQILAQVLKQNKYDGIIYYSTKRFSDVKFEKEQNVEVKHNIINIESKTKYKENLALFTNFNNEHVYDHELYSKLNISVPIDVSKVTPLSIDALRKMYSKIENTGISEITTKSDILISSFEREFSNMKVGENKYSETYMGQLHIYHIYCILNKMLCESIN